MKTETETGKTSRQLQAEQTQQAIFQAAIDLLQEKPFGDITIRDIVHRAHVSVGTFYHYYASKMEVYYETYRFADRYFKETVEPKLTQRKTTDRVKYFFTQYALYCSEMTDMRMTRILFHPDNPCFNRAAEDGMVGVLIRILRRGLSTGELIGSDSPETIANYLMIAVRGLVYHWCTKDGSYPLVPTMTEFVARLLTVYLAPEARVMRTPLELPF